MRKITAIICILIFILLPTNVYADMGPKPSVVLNFYGLNNEKCYVTLLSKEDSSGPWSVYKNTEDSKRLMENMDENIWQSFVNYKDNDGYYFLQFFDECTNNQRVTWGYHPPEEFKILLFFPDSHQFISSKTYKRYAFDSYYKVTIDSQSQQLNVTSQEWDRQIKVEQNIAFGWIQTSLFIRILLTIIIELMVANMFHIKNPKQRGLIIVTNIFTQLLLNALFNPLPLQQSTILLIFHYLWIELLVIGIEMVIYIQCIKKCGLPKPSHRKIQVYTMTANVISFLIGLITSSMI